MAPPQSDTHEIAFLEQDNGELQEDVVAKEQRRSGDERQTGNGEVDEEVDESFPASDPPSHWSGGDDGGASTAGPEQDRAASDRAPAGREVGRTPVEDVPQRRRPTDPVPRTLPAPSDPGTGESGA